MKSRLLSPRPKKRTSLSFFFYSVHVARSVAVSTGTNSCFRFHISHVSFLFSFLFIKTTAKPLPPTRRSVVVQRIQERTFTQCTERCRTCESLCASLVVVVSNSVPVVNVRHFDATTMPSRDTRTPRKRGYNRIINFTNGLACLGLLCFLLDIWMVEIILKEFTNAEISIETVINNTGIANGGPPVDLVREMPPLPMLKQPPPVYIMIPSVPRKNNPLYLHQVLESFRGFPLSHVYVFHNGEPGQIHSRWEEARQLYSGAHYIRNEAPAPPGHPSIFDLSIPLPPEIQHHVTMYNDTEVSLARNDTQDRKDWRRKECFDFTIMSQYTLSVIKDDPRNKNETWIIFNQDDAKWNVGFQRIYDLLQRAKAPRVDISRVGLVSVAFRADVLAILAKVARLWCDFKPVDWMVWDFFRTHGYCTQCDKGPRPFVTHIGEVSTRHGRIEGAEEADKAAKEAAAKKRKDALTRKKLEEQLKMTNLTSTDVGALTRKELEEQLKMVNVKSTDVGALTRKKLEEQLKMAIN